MKSNQNAKFDTKAIHIAMKNPVKIHTNVNLNQIKYDYKIKKSQFDMKKCVLDILMIN